MWFIPLRLKVLVSTRYVSLLKQVIHFDGAHWGQCLMLEPRHTEYWLRQPRFPVTVLRSLIEVILLSFAQLHRAKFFVLSNESHCFTFNSFLDLALKIGVAFSLFKGGFELFQG